MLPFTGGLGNSPKTIMRSQCIASSKVSFSRRGGKLSDPKLPRFAAPTARTRLAGRDCPWSGSEHCKTRDEIAADLSAQIPHQVNFGFGHF